VEYAVAFLPSAVRQLEALPGAARRSVLAAVEALASDPRPAGARRLEGIPEGVYRIRAGDIRVLYQVKDARLLVLVVRVANRREAYAHRALDRLRAQLRREGP
jgi:mRNA interferase RelE/StbE